MDVDEELETIDIKPDVPYEVCQLVKRVYDGCKKEHTDNQIAFPLNCFMRRATFYTGLKTNDVALILKENFMTTDETSNEFTINQKLAIRQVILQAYVERQKDDLNYVTYDAIKARCSQNGLESDHVTVTKLNSIGYGYVKTKQHENFLMENPKITFDRMLCLQKIQKAIEKSQPVYYLSAELLNKDAPVVGQVYFFFVISMDDYENGICCCDPTFDGYMKWLTHVLAPSLKASSLIVASNTPLKLQQPKEPITRYHNKKDMIKWLNDYNVPYIPTMCKAELFKLIEAAQSRKAVKGLILENILKASGHEVLILPDNLRDLSPADAIWKNLDFNKFPLDKKTNVFVKQENVKSAFENFSKDQFNKCYSEIKEIQTKFLKLDSEIEKLLDNYEFETDTNPFLI